MRKRAFGAFILLLAAASGFIDPPSLGQGRAEAAGTDTNKHFDVFSDALAKVRANYVVEPDESKLLEDAIKGVLTWLDRGRGGGLIAPPSPRQGKAVAFEDVLKQIRAHYAVKTDNSGLVEYAIRGAVAGLDPHSLYLSPKEVEQELEEERGGFGGLGVDVNMEGGGAKVIEALNTMPADRAGVLAGDTITAIDGKSIKGLSMSAAGDKMRGPVGSSVTLTLARNGVVMPVTVKVVRDIIRVNPVQYSVEGDVGWIKVKSFEHRYTADRVRWAVEDIKKVLGSKVSGYVLDLRNNPGGLLDQAIAVADAFLDGGAIVMTKGRSASDIHRAYAKPGDITDGKPLVVLINGGSASASEVVAGALQDNNRATLLGTRSYGKGSVQALIPLVNKGAIRLTTARYYTPSGRSIQATGIEPDYDLEPGIPQLLMLELASMPIESEAQLRGHLKNDGAQERTGSSTYVPKEKATDDQLNAAIALIHAQLPDTDQSADGSNSLGSIEQSGFAPGRARS